MKKKSISGSFVIPRIIIFKAAYLQQQEGKFQDNKEYCIKFL